MGQRTHEEVRDRSGDLWGGLGRFVEHFGKSGTSRETLEEDRDGLGDPRGGP